MTRPELWALIDSYPSYEVSSFGRVRRVVACRNSKPGRILKAPLRNGYPCVDLCREGQARLTSVHTLVANTFVPNPNSLPEVNHKNGIRTDCRAENLEWVTRRQNAQHAHDLNLQVCLGERNGQAKLTEEAALEILRQKGGRRGLATSLGKQYGVSQTTVRDIWRGKTWPHLQGGTCQRKAA